MRPVAACSGAAASALARAAHPPGHGTPQPRPRAGAWPALVATSERCHACTETASQNLKVLSLVCISSGSLLNISKPPARDARSPEARPCVDVPAGVPGRRWGRAEAARAPAARPYRQPHARALPNLSSPQPTSSSLSPSRPSSDPRHLMLRQLRLRPTAQLCALPTTLTAHVNIPTRLMSSSAPRRNDTPGSAGSPKEDNSVGPMCE